MIHRINIPCIPRHFDNDVLPYNLNWWTWIIYNVYCISIMLNRLQWFNGYLASLQRWRLRFDSHGRKYFFVFTLIFPIFYIFCNKNLVAFYIKFNALAKSSHQPLLYIYIYIFLSQSFQHTPLKILVNFESGVHVFSGVLCCNAWNSAIHLFIIWFTDILANLDIQTELQNCLYEYGFKDK